MLAHSLGTLSHKGRGEGYDDPTTAIAREKAIKKWRRAWKLRLIEQSNPQWLDLYEQISQ